MADAIASDSVVSLKAPRPEDSRLLVNERDDEFFRWLGPGSDSPQPAACIWVGDQVVGWLDYDPDPAWLQPGEVNVGYCLFRHARRKGYATRAVERLLCHLRSDTDFIRATLLIHPENTKSLAVARRLGFVETGEMDGELFFTRDL